MLVRDLGLGRFKQNQQSFLFLQGSGWEMGKGDGGENYSRFLGRKKESLVLIKVSHLKLPGAGN